MPTIREAGKLIQLFKFKALLLDEFIPLVEYYQSEHDPSLGTIKNDEDEFTLSSLIDENLRTIKPSVITTEIRSIWLPFFVKKGCSDSLDKDGIIEIKLSDKSGDIRLVGSNHIRTSFGSKIKVEIDINCKSDIEFFVDFYASDDTKDEKYIGEAKNVHCGRFKVCFKYLAITVGQDVFSKEEGDLLIDEINFIKAFADVRNPSEYSGNYCMAAAERGLSKLLNNTTDFYSVDRSHKKRNSISFAGKTAADRGEQFKALGFVKSVHDFNRYKIDVNLRSKIKNDTERNANLYNIVTLEPGSTLYDYLLASISDKCGIHVYYMSISDGYHTLLLVIDNRDFEKPKYAIYDQHGKTSSFGYFSNIEKGFAQQTSWTHLEDYGERGYNPNNYGKVITKIWKIQRQH